MSKSYTAEAEEFYKLLSEKNVEGMAKFLHPDVRFIGPLAEIKGKEAYLDATRKFAHYFKDLKIRAKFGSGDQAMIVYDLECPPPVKKFPTAILMGFQDGLIVKIEAFYDASPFAVKKEEIFS